MASAATGNATPNGTATVAPTTDTAPLTESEARVFMAADNAVHGATMPGRITRSATLLQLEHLAHELEASPSKQHLTRGQVMRILGCSSIEIRQLQNQGVLRIRPNDTDITMFTTNSVVAHIKRTIPDAAKNFADLFSKVPEGETFDFVYTTFLPRTDASSNRRMIERGFKSMSRYLQAIEKLAGERQVLVGIDLTNPWTCANSQLHLLVEAVCKRRVRNVYIYYPTDLSDSTLNMMAALCSANDVGLYVNNGGSNPQACRRVEAGYETVCRVRHTAAAEGGAGATAEAKAPSEDDASDGEDEEEEAEGKVDAPPSGEEELRVLRRIKLSGHVRQCARARYFELAAQFGMMHAGVPIPMEGVFQNDISALRERFLQIQELHGPTSEILDPRLIIPIKTLRAALPESAEADDSLFVTFEDLAKAAVASVSKAEHVQLRLIARGDNPKAQSLRTMREFFGDHDIEKPLLTTEVDRVIAQVKARRVQRATPTTGQRKRVAKNQAQAGSGGGAADHPTSASVSAIGAAAPSAFGAAVAVPSAFGVDVVAQKPKPKKKATFATPVDGTAAPQKRGRPKTTSADEQEEKQQKQRRREAEKARRDHENKAARLAAEEAERLATGESGRVVKAKTLEVGGEVVEHESEAEEEEEVEDGEDHGEQDDMDGELV